MDVLFDQPAKVQFEEKLIPPTTQASTQASTQPTSQPATTLAAATAPTNAPTHAPTTTQAIAQYRRTDHDAELAAAMQRIGNIIVPATFQPAARYSPIVAAMVEELRKDPELEPKPLADILRKRGDVKVEEGGLGEQFFVARREAFDARLRELNLGPETPFDTVRAKLLPRTPVEIHTGAANVLEQQWTKYLAAREFRRFAWPQSARDDQLRLDAHPARAGAPRSPPPPAVGRSSITRSSAPPSSARSRCCWKRTATSTRRWASPSPAACSTPTSRNCASTRTAAG
jgi:hypothetical protein